MYLRVNTTLNQGRYRIVKRIGDGGFGITYKAIDNSTGEFVVIKEFFPREAYERMPDSTQVRFKSTITNSRRATVEKAKQKFIGEADKLRDLNHPGIVKFKENFFDNGTAYYVMEYLEGKTLAQLIETQALTFDYALELIYKVGNALSYVHSENILHLDIKPANIMIRTQNSEPVIIDFGISRSFNEVGMANTVTFEAFSSGYAPYEQINGEVHSFLPQVDVYALGATLYTILNRQKLNFPTSDLSKNLQFESNIPVYAREIIRKSLAFNWKDRYASVSDFLNALRNKKSPTDTSFSEKTKVKQETHQKASSPQTGASSSSKPDKSNSGSGKIGYIFLAFVAVIFIIGFLTGKPSIEDANQPAEINLDSQAVEAINVTGEDTVQDPSMVGVESFNVNNFATRQYSINGYEYNYRYELKAENGILYISMSANGQHSNDQINYNPNVDAEKILDQFEGLTYFWAAADVGYYIIDSNDFYSEEIMNSTLKFLKKSMNLLSTGKGDCPTAYSGAKSRYDMLKAIHKDWENSSSFNPQWAQDIEMIIYGMGENPIQAKDIYYKF